MVALNFRQGSAAGHRRLGEELLAGLTVGNGVAEGERIPARRVAGDQNAGIAVGPGYRSKGGLGIVEQLVKTAWLGNNYF
jgi:hypothetical protein